MRKARILGITIALMSIVLPSAEIHADEPDASPASVVIGVQVRDDDGNTDKFLEDSFGGRDGLFLERLQYRSSTEDLNIHLDARFTSGRNGWFDLDFAGDRWSGGVNTKILTSWSSNTFADASLPSGTPVATLFPGTTELDPLFGVSEPRSEILQGEAWLRYRFSGYSRITLRAGARERDGERVPNIGGFSFSDRGTASFYTAGLERFDSSSSWLNLEGVFEAGPIGLRVAGGIESSDVDSRTRMPAYGPSGLLDLNEWRDASNTDSTWLRVDARWKSLKTEVYWAVSYLDATTKPAGGDRRVDAAGTPILEGLSIQHGQIDSTHFSAAMGIAWNVKPSLTMTAAFDTRSADTDGNLDLFQREEPIQPALSSYEENRVGGTFQLKFDQKAYWLRFRARGTSTDLDRREARESFAVSTERKSDRFDARLDASARLAPAWDLSAWMRYDDEDVDVRLDDLWNGYATGDWSRKTTSASLALKYAAKGLHASLRATSESTDFGADSPWYDPIFDPSVDLLPVTSDSDTKRISGSLMWPFDRGSVWIEGGWLKTDIDIPTEGPNIGFAALAEKVSGTVAAFGLDLGLWEGGSVMVQLERVSDHDDLDSDITRGKLQLDEELSDIFALFGRWSYWKLSNNEAPVEDYEVNVFAAGVKLRF